MADKKNSIPVVSMSNTKKELIDAYEQMKKQLVASEKDLLDAQKARELAEKDAAISVAEKAVEADPVKRIHELRSSLGKELLSLAEEFENEVETYKKVDEAVRLKQVELQTLYQIEGAASDLVVLIEAQNQRKSDFEVEMATTQQTFDLECKEKRDLWEKEKKETAARLAAEREQLKCERQRETEEYDYALSREREIKQNQLKDDLGALEKEIASQREIFEAETAKRTEQLDLREREIAEREKQVDGLQGQVDGFDAKLQSAVDAAVKQITKQLNTEFAAQRALDAANADGEKRILESKTEHLERLVTAQAKQIEQLEAKQENAYQKVQDIASRAVDAARREVISYPVPQSDSDK
jgi:hypothetical protein